MVDEYDLNDPEAVRHLISRLAYHAATMAVAMERRQLVPAMMRAKFSLDKALAELRDALAEVS